MRKVISILGALLLLAFIASPAESATYWFQVKDEQGRAVTSGFTAQVYTAASTTHDAVFTDSTYKTARTNPVNPDSSGVVKFATSDSTVDIVVWGTGGRVKGAVGRVDDLTDTDHVVVLLTNQVEKHLRLFWDSALSNGAEKDTGVDLPTGAMVIDAWVEVATAAVRASVSVGLLSTEASGNASGFCASQGADSAAAPGQWFRCEASRSAVTTVEGARGHEAFYYSSNTRGILLASYARGQNSLTGADTTAGVMAMSSRGMYSEHPHVVQQGAATSITYTTNHRTSAGYIHLFYKELRRR